MTPMGGRRRPISRRRWARTTNYEAGNNLPDKTHRKGICAVHGALPLARLRGCVSPCDSALHRASR